MDINPSRPEQQQAGERPLNLSDFAQRNQITEDRVWELIEEGELAARFVNDEILILREQDASDPGADALDPAAIALNPAANALNPATNALNPAANALNPAANALNPAANALNPAANALNPAPVARYSAADGQNPAQSSRYPAVDALDIAADTKVHVPAASPDPRQKPREPRIEFAEGPAWNIAIASETPRHESAPVSTPRVEAADEDNDDLPPDDYRDLLVFAQDAMNRTMDLSRQLLGTKDELIRMKDERIQHLQIELQKNEQEIRRLKKAIEDLETLCRLTPNL